MSQNLSDRRHAFRRFLLHSLALRQHGTTIEAEVSLVYAREGVQFSTGPFRVSHVSAFSSDTLAKIDQAWEAVEADLATALFPENPAPTTPELKEM